MNYVMAKGPNFVFAREYVQTKHGYPCWETVLSLLPGETAAVWRDAQLDRQYPFAKFKEGVAIIAQVVGMPGNLETANMYMYIAERSLNTIYQTFFQLAKPYYVLNKFPHLWAQFFDTGTVEVITLRDNEVQLKFTVPEIFLDWLPAACLGYSKKAIELAGGKHLAIHPLDRSCVRYDAWQVSYKLSWI